MRAVLQRVAKAGVEVNNTDVAQIETGLLLFVGIDKEDRKEDAEYLAGKISRMRIFPDSENKLNLSVMDIKGDILAVSQFTLCANAHKGNRPSFSHAMEFNEGKKLYEYFVECLMTHGLNVKKGVYGADMQISLINNGPVTILIDSKKAF